MKIFTNNGTHGEVSKITCKNSETCNYHEERKYLKPELNSDKKTME
jgi:hypothetical protein